MVRPSFWARCIAVVLTSRRLWFAAFAASVAGTIAVGAVPEAPASVARAQMSPWQWQGEEVQRYFLGLSIVQTSGWGRLSAPVNRVVRELIQHTGVVFRVVPGQTMTIGQAHIGGWIILDISTATRPDDELAFWLAHEWGHEYLGHQPNYLHPYGTSWQPRFTPTQDEDAADDFAGGFLCASGRSITRVAQRLRSLPRVHGDFSHSDGQQRARTALAAYARAGCGGDGPGDDSRPEPPARRCHTEYEECTHQAHPRGDLMPCSHVAHPRGDVYPCGHVCFGPYGGAGPCHPMGDLMPCTHPAHPMGDAYPCTHQAHPGGHPVEVCD